MHEQLVSELSQPRRQRAFCVGQVAAHSACRRRLMIMDSCPTTGLTVRVAGGAQRQPGARLRGCSSADEWRPVSGARQLSVGQFRSVAS